MKFAPFLFKPRWQHKDAAVRRAAIADSADAQLAVVLPRIAREDRDAGVRLAALKRAPDPALAQTLAHDDADTGVRASARALYLDLMAGTHPASPPLSERLRLLRAQDKPAILEHLAVAAREPELRGAALAHVARPALLAERAVSDPDPALRLAALERIGDESQLERIAERARKSDKQLNRAARDRLAALRIARGDPATVSDCAKALCERLEQHLRTSHSDPAEETAIAAEWAVLAPHVAPALATRYAAAQDLLARSRNPAAIDALREQSRMYADIDEELAGISRKLAALPSADAAHDLAAHFAGTARRYAALSPDGDPTSAWRDAIETRLTTLASEFAQLARIPAVDAQPEEPRDRTAADALLAQARFEAALGVANAAAQREREQQRACRIAELEQHVAALETALDRGEAGAAHAAHARLAGTRKRLGKDLPHALARRLAAGEKRYGDLARWQHWADNQRRRQLCEEVAALPGAGLHPDAVATRVREAQAEWARLDVTEGSDRAPSDGLARRFRALCRQAIEPARPYFEKRDELRKSHAEQLTILLGRVSGLPQDSEDWKAIAALRREAADALRALDGVEPRERKAFAKRIKDALSALDQRMDRRHAEVRAAKTKLIANAQALAEQPASADAVRNARALQRDWQGIGNGRRSDDNRQWTAFRTALDTVFARLDAERAEQSAREQHAQQQALAVCTEAETLAATAVAIDRAQLAALDARWTALDVRDAALRSRYREALAAIREAGSRRQRAARRARFDAWLARYRLCREAEQGRADAKDLRMRFDAGADSVAAQALSERFQRALHGDLFATSAVDDASARDLLVQLEYLAGMDSPDEDRQRRLDHQVARLSARMRGAETLDAGRQLEQWLNAWTHTPLPNDATTLDTRLERALTSALDSLA